MLWIGFGWPVVFGDDPASPWLRIAALSALWTFLSSLAALLCFRGRELRANRRG